MKDSEEMIKSALIIILIIGLYVYVFASMEKSKIEIKEKISKNERVRKSHW